MSQDLRDGQVFFSGGCFFDLTAKNDAAYLIGIPLDGHSLYNLASEYDESRQIGLKNLMGYIQYGNMSIQFDDIYELHDFLNYVDDVIEKRNGEVSAEKILAAIKMEGQQSIKAARNVVDHIDDFKFIADACSYEELGRRLLQELIPQDVFTEIEPALSVELYGRFYADNCEYNCCITDTGFIERIADPQPFDLGESPPEPELQM